MWNYIVPLYLKTQIIAISLTYFVKALKLERKATSKLVQEVIKHAAAMGSFNFFHRNVHSLGWCDSYLLNNRHGEEYLTWYRRNVLKEGNVRN